jgi:hypothetical protein
MAPRHTNIGVLRIPQQQSEDITYEVDSPSYPRDQPRQRDQLVRVLVSRLNKEPSRIANGGRGGFCRIAQKPDFFALNNLMPTD